LFTSLQIKATAPEIMDTLDCRVFVRKRRKHKLSGAPLVNSTTTCDHSGLHGVTILGECRMQSYECARILSLYTRSSYPVNSHKLCDTFTLYYSFLNCGWFIKIYCDL